MPSYVLVSLLALLLACLPYRLSAAEINVNDIVAHCSNKYQGDDQQSKLTVTFKNSAGKVQKTGFTRLWKNFAGKDDLLEKVIMITEYPADKKDIRFIDHSDFSSPRIMGCTTSLNNTKKGAS